MSYVPPTPQPGGWEGVDSNYARGQELIGREEAFAAEQRLAREAEAATGGTPTQKLWRRVKRVLGRSSGD